LEEKQMESYQSTDLTRPGSVQTPEKRDLDDLIFQGEGWLASDR